MKKSNSQYYIIVLFGLLWLGLIVVNVVKNDKFLDTSAATMLQLGIVVSVSYYLVQKQSDARKTMDYLEKVIGKCSDAVELYCGAITVYINTLVNDQSSPAEKEYQRSITLSQYRRVTNYIGAIGKFEYTEKARKELVDPLIKDLSDVLSILDELPAHELQDTSALRVVEKTRYLIEYKLVTFMHDMHEQ